MRGPKGLQPEEIAGKVSARQEGVIKFLIPFFQIHGEKVASHPKDGSMLKDSSNPSGLQKCWGIGSGFSTEIHFK